MDEAQDLSNESEIADIFSEEQPQEPVTGDEDGGESQPPSEPEEFDVVLGGEDQDSQQPATVPLYKLKKLRGKNKELKSANAQVNTENETLKAELNELRSQVAKVTAGPEPSFYDYDSEDDYRAAYSKWFAANNSAANPAPRQQPESVPSQSSNVSQSIPDSVFDDHYGRAADLGAKYNIADYEAAEGGLRDKLESEFPGQGGVVADAIINATGEKSHLVMYALSKSDAKYNTLVSTMMQDAQNGTANTQKLMWKWEQDAKIDSRRRSVETKPETIPEGKGDANSLERQINKQYEKWLESGDAADHRKLKELRKQRGAS